MVYGAVRGLRTKVWVWSGVEEEVEIEKNDGEGKEEWHFLVWVPDHVSSLCRSKKLYIYILTNKIKWKQTKLDTLTAST